MSSHSSIEYPRRCRVVLSTTDEPQTGDRLYLMPNGNTFLLELRRLDGREEHVVGRVELRNGTWEEGTPHLVGRLGEHSEIDLAFYEDRQSRKSFIYGRLGSGSALDREKTGVWVAEEEEDGRIENI